MITIQYIGPVDEVLECLSPVLFIGGLLFVISVVAFLSYLEQEGIEKKKEVWQSFAAANQLQFVPRAARDEGARVKGLYRGYQFELFTFRGGRGKSAYVTTRLEMRVPSSTSSHLPQSNGTGELGILVHQEWLTLGQAVDQLVPLLMGTNLSGQIQLIGYYGGVACEQPLVITDTELLQTLLDRLSNILDYYYPLVDLGGEAVPLLEEMAIRGKYTVLGKSLLKGIEEKTTHLMSNLEGQALCPRCFLYTQPHRIRLSWLESMNYYGCRSCGQSREFFYCPMGVAVVLDSRWTRQYIEQNDSLRVNWLKRRSLFDFDRVEIIKATDEEVERFAVQVGNDTDPIRKPRYREMICTIGSDCQLSENTLRILGRMFGKVEHQMGVMHESIGS